MAHRFILGSSGSGKSTFIKQEIISDIKRGNAVCFIDPHGQDIDDLLTAIPDDRVDDVILFDPTDREYIFSWNPLSESADPYLTANITAGAIKDSSGYGGSATPLMSMYLRFIFATLIEKNQTLYDSLELLDKSTIASRNDVFARFWKKYTGLKTERDKQQRTDSSTNKLYTLLFDPYFQELFKTRDGKFKMSEAVNNKIVLIKLPQGQLGLEMVQILGSFILSQIHLACLNRDTKKQFSLYIDEVHTFAPSTIIEKLSGLRKFNVNITCAHQFIDQADPKLFTSLIGNCSEKCIFRVSREDADRLTPRLTPNAVHSNLDEIPPFTYRNLPYKNTDNDTYVTPLTHTKDSTPDRIRENTRKWYCR